MQAPAADQGIRRLALGSEMAGGWTRLDAASNFWILGRYFPPEIAIGLSRIEQLAESWNKKDPPYKFRTVDLFIAAGFPANGLFSTTARSRLRRC